MEVKPITQNKILGIVWKKNPTTPPSEPGIADGSAGGGAMEIDCGVAEGTSEGN